MSRLLGKTLGTVLKVFVKNYTDQHLNVDVFRGEVSLKGIDLNEKVLQRLLGLPPTLVLERVRCGFLRLRIPWRHLTTQPVLVTAEVITADVAQHSEPVHVPPLPPVLLKWLGGGSGGAHGHAKKGTSPSVSPAPAPPPPPGGGAENMHAGKMMNFVETIVEGIMVEVKGLYLNVSLIKDPSASPPAMTTLCVKLEGLTLDNSNHKFEACPSLKEAAGWLAKVRKEGFNRRMNELTSFKQLRLGELSVTLAGKTVVKLNRVMCVNVSSRRRLTEVIPNEINVSADLPTVYVFWTDLQLWQSTMAFLSSLLALLSPSGGRPGTTLSTASVRALSLTPPSVSPASSSPSLSEDNLSDSASDTASTLDLEIDELSKELDGGGHGAPPPAKKIEFPVIQFNATVHNVIVGWADVLTVVLDEISASMSVEKTPLHSGGSDIRETVVAADRMPGKVKKKFVTNNLVQIKIDTLSMSGLCEKEGMTPFRSKNGRFLESCILYQTKPAPGSVSEISRMIDVVVEVAEFGLTARASQYGETICQNLASWWRSVSEDFLAKLPKDDSKMHISPDLISWMVDLKCRVALNGLFASAVFGAPICARVGQLVLSKEPGQSPVYLSLRDTAVVVAEGTDIVPKFTTDICLAFPAGLVEFLYFIVNGETLKEDAAPPMAKIGVHVSPLAIRNLPGLHMLNSGGVLESTLEDFRRAFFAADPSRRPSLPVIEPPPCAPSPTPKPLCQVLPKFGLSAEIKLDRCSAAVAVASGPLANTIKCLEEGASDLRAMKVLLSLLFDPRAAVGGETLELANFGITDVVASMAATCQGVNGKLRVGEVSARLLNVVAGGLEATVLKSSFSLAQPIVDVDYSLEISDVAIGGERPVDLLTHRCKASIGALDADVRGLPTREVALINKLFGAGQKPAAGSAVENSPTVEASVPDSCRRVLHNKFDVSVALSDLKLVDAISALKLGNSQLLTTSLTLLLPTVVNPPPSQPATSPTVTVAECQTQTEQHAECSPTTAPTVAQSAPVAVAPQSGTVDAPKRDSPADVETLRKELDAKKKELDATEDLLVRCKLETASLKTSSDELNLQLMQLKKTHQPGGSDVLVFELTEEVKRVKADRQRVAQEREELRQELEAIRRETVAATKAREETTVTSTRTLVTEYESRIKKLEDEVEIRTQQLLRAQKTIAERVGLEDELRNARNRLAALAAETGRPPPLLTSPGRSSSQAAPPPAPRQSTASRLKRILP